MSVSRWLSSSSFRLPVSAAAHLLTTAGKGRCQSFARKALELVQGRRFDVVQAHHEKALIAADAIRRHCGGRLLFDAVELPFDPDALPAKADMRALRLREIAYERAIASDADGWITVGDFLAETIASRLAVPKPAIVRNCCLARPPGNDGRLRREFGLSGDSKIVLALNSLRPDDGLEVVVDALSLLPADIHLVVLGQESRPGIFDALRQRGLRAGAGRLHFAPLQTVSRLLDYVAGADMGIIPLRPKTTNLQASLPNRLFELLACGLPVAVSRLRDPATLIERYHAGLVYDEDDARSAAHAISTILAPDAYAGFRRNAARAASELTWEHEAVRYLELVSLAVGQAHPEGDGSPPCFPSRSRPRPVLE